MEHPSWIHRHIETRTSTIRGTGQFALEDIPKDTILINWCGRYCRDIELKDLPAEELNYTLQVDDNKHQIAFVFGVREPADYTNHSCSPNAGFLGAEQLRAMKDIKKGEEITFDYAMCENSSNMDISCECGAPLCRGKVRDGDWRKEDLQARYGDYFSAYLLEKIKKMKGQ
jgi:SET domain-containing protein